MAMYGLCSSGLAFLFTNMLFFLSLGVLMLILETIINRDQKFLIKFKQYASFFRKVGSFLIVIGILALIFYLITPSILSFLLKEPGYDAYEPICTLQAAPAYFCYSSVEICSIGVILLISLGILIFIIRYLKQDSAFFTNWGEKLLITGFLVAICCYFIVPHIYSGFREGTIWSNNLTYCTPPPEPIQDCDDAICDLYNHTKIIEVNKINCSCYGHIYGRIIE